MRVVVPEGSFGVEDEETWAGLLRRLTRELDQRGVDAGHGCLGGDYGYGADYENDVFLMHGYCWCEQDDCPWCVGCSCPESAFHYFVDGQEVACEEWDGFFQRQVAPFGAIGDEGRDHDGWMQAADEANKRRTERHDPECDYCLTGGVAASKGGGPQLNAPNFWHKASGLKVWWYKYIGRGMEFDGTGDPLAIIPECIASLP